jgi:SAM-dependent methyltransferase
MVCFFSVFTHLRHEETYLYLQEARRVLTPSGKIIFSFLEFPNPHHWNVFEHNLTQVAGMEPLNQFISIDAIKIWALHLGLRVTSLNRAGKITLSQAYQLQDGRVLQGTVLFGQSVCVLSKEQSGRLRQKVNNGLFRLADRLQRIQV